MRYVNVVRIQNSTTMLSETNKSITEIAFTCGFDTLEVFEAAHRETERHRSRERRHGLKKIYLGNEDYEAKLGMVTQTPDEDIHSNMYLEYLKKFFDDKVYKRGIRNNQGCKEKEKGHRGVTAPQ